MFCDFVFVFVRLYFSLETGQNGAPRLHLTINGDVQPIRLTSQNTRVRRRLCRKRVVGDAQNRMDLLLDVIRLKTVRKRVVPRAILDVIRLESVGKRVVQHDIVRHVDHTLRGKLEWRSVGVERHGFGLILFRGFMVSIFLFGLLCGLLR